MVDFLHFMSYTLLRLNLILSWDLFIWQSNGPEEQLSPMGLLKTHKEFIPEQ